LGEYPISEIENTLATFNSLEIPLRFTYTNCALQPEHYHNNYANIITALAETGKNEILVNDPQLEEYLKSNFPNYKYILSTTKCITDNDEIIQKSNHYDLSVLDFRKNIDFEFLKSLEYPEKFEILLNAHCDPRCPRRQEHYYSLSLK
jgi:hypothetical protein